MFEALLKNKNVKKLLFLGGLGAFVVFITAPFWLNVFTPRYKRPHITLPKSEEACVETRDYMRAEHMQILNVWRDAAVREGKREFVDANGKSWDINLQNTCMSCHANKPDFCDKCHESNAVDPYCWDCHVEPKGNAR